MKKNIICIDRDGTLIFDSKSHFFLGKDSDWKSKVEILPYVIEGLKKLNEQPETAIYMITNQSGVAICDYPLLTLEKAHEVCKYVVHMIQEKGAVIDGYFLCPHATPEYVSKKPGVCFDSAMVHDCACLKPALGMVFNALKEENLTPENANIYVIGDRGTDVQTALNINRTGVLIPFENEPGEEEAVRKIIDQSRVHVAGNLLEAAEFINKNINYNGTG